MLAFADGTRYELGRVAGRCSDSQGGAGTKAVSLLATVWDEEIEGMRLARESLSVTPLLVMSDSAAAIPSIWSMAEYGRAWEGTHRRFEGCGGYGRHLDWGASQDPFGACEDPYVYRRK